MKETPPRQVRVKIKPYYSGNSLRPDMEKEINKLYREIAETVDVMIPENWNKFYFYAQISEAGGGTYFFYNKEGDLNKFQYSVEIPFKYDIDTDTFEYNDMKLFDLCEKLRLVFKENGQELWYSFTMSFRENRKV